MTDLKSTSSGLTIGRIRLIGLLASLLVAAALIFTGQDRLRNPVYDLWQRLVPRDMTHTNVRIVWIDDDSVKEYGAWPWTRLNMKVLAQNLLASGAELVGFDILFTEADAANPKKFASLYKDLPQETLNRIEALPSMDDEFASAMQMGPVVVARVGVDREPPDKPVEIASTGEFTAPLGPGVRHWRAGLVNIPVIEGGATGYGLINGDPDSDGVIRRIPLAGNLLGTDSTGFALEAARLSKGGLPLRPKFKGKTLTGLALGNQMLPTDSQGRMMVRFGTFPIAAQFSAASILNKDFDPSAFAGKIVLIGRSDEAGSDVVPTPLKAQGLGTEVQAITVDAILNNDMIERPAWAWIAEGLLAVLLVVVTVRLMPRLGVKAAVSIQLAVILSVFLSSFAAFRFHGWLLDPVSPIVVAIATGLTMLLLLFAKVRTERAQLAEALQEERLAAARSAGELAAARDIQLGMLPRSASLAGLDPAVEVDAFVEPARSIGGDFYDAMRIDEDRICFLVGDVTGKGVPAALFMALSKALTKSVLLRDGMDLAAAVTRLNDEIARDNSEDMFVTMLFGLFDTRTGELALCNAGHENPWIVRADGSVDALNPEGGPPLSVAPGFVYDSETINLWPGDAVVIVSDGITEAQSPDGKFFGHDRLAAVLRNWNPDEDVNRAGAALLREVRAFESGEDATDDLTVLAFRYRPI